MDLSRSFHVNSNFCQLEFTCEFEQANSFNFITHKVYITILVKDYCEFFKFAHESYTMTTEIEVSLARVDMKITFWHKANFNGRMDLP